MSEKSLAGIFLLVVLVNAGCTLPQPPVVNKTDDWQYAPGIGGDYGGVGISKTLGGTPLMAEASGTIGYSTGGAKDVNNFRENVNNSYFPLFTDITYEGLFYDYFFDTGEQEACEKLFCPSYSYAISRDPLSGEEEYYLSVGLNSGIKESDFERKKLNLVIVLDISGSMGAPFNSYYYDRFGRRIEISEENDSGKSKMQIASESVVALLEHLEDDDYFGMVLFESQAYLAKPLSRVGDTDMQAIKDHVLEIGAGGGTQMSAGMNMGTELYSEFMDADKSEYENRIIFLTDAMPNIGETSEEGLLGMTEANSEDGIYTTFIGIGVDFNTELVEYITKIKGSNYYSVHSAAQFKDRMDEEFEYMVTPLVFNLELSLEASGYEIEKVYGSPEADEATGQVMYVNTLFPSKRVEEETKGGLVLLKLKKISNQTSLKLKVTYEDRNGEEDSDEKNIEIGSEDPDFFQNTGIRKGILLSRYANLVKNWIIDERTSMEENVTIVPSVCFECGIIVPPEPALGQWERQSVPLHISEPYRELFGNFSAYFEGEMADMGDETLRQELDILALLANYTSG